MIARECALSYWAIDQLSDTFTAMRDAGVDKDASRVEVAVTKGGEYVAIVTDPEGRGQGGPLPVIQRDVEVAALDEDLYAACEGAIDGLAEAEHVYQSLVHGLDKHFPSTLAAYYDGLSEYGLKELSKSAAELKRLYFVCTASELKRGKLR